MDESNGYIFDTRTHKFLGKRVKTNKKGKNNKYDYIFNP